MTPEQQDAERAHRREYARSRVATMTPEQHDAERAQKREYACKRRTAMTPEQRDAKRKYEREYGRKRRAARRESGHSPNGHAGSDEAACASSRLSPLCGRASQRAGHLFECETQALFWQHWRTRGGPFSIIFVGDIFND
jgi:hypothetical protein